MEYIKQISDIGFLPLLVLDDAATAVPLARALLAGNIPVAEVTLRTPAALESIRRIAQEVPEVIVGVGTVHNVSQAKQAVSAGAKFIVTPGFQPDVVRWCVENKVEVVPGVVSPSDIEQALSFGLSVCKFFPAEAYGGIKTLKALSGPYQEIKFVPTGGVDEKNMLDYLALPNVAAVGGSFLVPDKLVKANAWDEITALCQSLVFEMLGFQLLHVGINTDSAEESAQAAGRIAQLFGVPVRDTPKANFAGSIAEVMKLQFLGSKGHIGISARDIDRAVLYFKKMGVSFQEDTMIYDEAGRLINVYFKEEIAGFAFHLRRFGVE